MRYTLDNKSTAELQELLEMSAGILIGLATERAGLHHHNKTRLDLEIFPSGDDEELTTMRWLVRLPRVVSEVIRDELESSSEVTLDRNESFAAS